MDIQFMSQEIEAFYPYRRAYVLPLVVVALDDWTIKMVKRFIERYGYKMDNHICWKADGMCYQYSDHNLYIGNRICEQKW